MSDESDEEFSMDMHVKIKKRKLNEDSKKNKLLPVETLSVFFCCSLFCLGGIPMADLCLAREHYCLKTKQEKSQYIMDTIILNTSSTGKCSFSIGSVPICLAAWRAVLGIPESSFYNIKKQVTDGNRVINPSGKIHGSLDRKTQMAIVWLKDFTNTYAAAMPDSSQLHLPCCLTKTSVYELMKFDLTDIGETCLSMSHFLCIWRRDLRHIAIPKTSRFSECTICSLIKKSLSETKDKQVRSGLLEQRNKHLWQQRSERQKYYKHQMKSKREPSKYLSIIMDAMDQNKTMIPHFNKPPKSTDGMWKLKTHLLAAKVHGVGIYGFFDIFQWPHGSNLTITALFNILNMMKDSLPEVLYLQMDNCGRENKNRFSVWLNKNNALSMEELIKGFEDSFTPNPIGVEQSMVYNFSEWIMKYISPMRKHSQPHVFKIFKVDRKAKIVCKQWTTDKVYKECVGSMEYLINEIPKDAPEAICPIYNELDKVKDSITLAKPFLNSREQTQWQNFFKDKEEEEFDFKAESNFKLLELSEYVKQKRIEKSRNYQPVTIPQIVTDDKDMEPVVIGKLTASKKSNNIKSLALEVGQMVLVDIEKYADEWPQLDWLRFTGTKAARQDLGVHVPFLYQENEEKECHGLKR
ncbi:Hypothetical predicted protein [Mytilus galloprovincialis]|nr:Hypothetical predicted protein [Mytilus galloprovincialis]